MLSHSLAATLLTTLKGFIAASHRRHRDWRSCSIVSKWVEYSLFPYAVVLQVTPVIAIAPLLLIYLPQETAVVACAFIVAFFPVLSNTTLGLNSVDRNLAGLFHLYGATRLQTLRPAETAIGTALHPGRPAHRRRPVADRRRRCRNRGRHRPEPDRGWPTGSPNPAIASTYPAHVRSAGFAVIGRDCHLWAAGANFASGTAPLA